jgi:hypothetical protein
MDDDVVGNARDGSGILGQPLGIRGHQQLHVDAERGQPPRELQRALHTTAAGRWVVERDQEDAEAFGH